LSHFPPKKTCVQVVAPSFWLPSGEITPHEEKKREKKKPLHAMQKKEYFIFIVN
jgi:hypothetical protein